MLIIDGGIKNEVKLFQIRLIRPRQSLSLVFVENLIPNIVLTGRLLPVDTTTFKFGLIDSASDNNNV